MTPITLYLSDLTATFAQVDGRVQMTTTYTSTGREHRVHSFKDEAAALRHLLSTADLLASLNWQQQHNDLIKENERLRAMTAGTPVEVIDAQEALSAAKSAALVRSIGLDSYHVSGRADDDAAEIARLTSNLNAAKQRGVAA